MPDRAPMYECMYVLTHGDAIAAEERNQSLALQDPVEQVDTHNRSLLIHRFGGVFALLSFRVCCLQQQ